MPYVKKCEYITRIHREQNVEKAETIDLKDTKRRHRRRTTVELIKTLFFIKKLSVVEIGKTLDIPNRSVRNMLEKVRKQIKDDAKRSVLAEERTQEFVWNLTINYEERIKKLWGSYVNAENESTKVDVLREIRNNEKQYLDTMQSLGIMPNIKPADEIEGKLIERETLVIIAESEKKNEPIITEADSIAPAPGKGLEIQ